MKPFERDYYYYFNSDPIEINFSEKIDIKTLFFTLVARSELKAVIIAQFQAIRMNKNLINYMDACYDIDNVEYTKEINKKAREDIISIFKPR